MKGGIKIYGLLVLFVSVISIILIYSIVFIGKDEIFNSVRHTQYNTIEEAINIGDLIVNNNISIDEDRTKDLWIKNFNDNITTSVKHDIDFVSINESPAAIAVNVKGEYLKENTNFNYSNVIILDRLK